MHKIVQRGSAIIVTVVLTPSTIALSEVRSAIAQPTAQAAAVLRDRQGNVVGDALLSETPDGVRIQVDIDNFESAVTGSEPSQHGFHIHEIGACEPPDFQSAGGHFNPTGVGHGLLDTDGPHAGDLPNLSLDPTGNADYEVTTKLITLSPGERSIFDQDGSAFVLHQQPDDYITDPAGDSGDRIACGVIMPR